LALYRILQKALENVEKHARARHVTVCLRQRTFVQLTIHDDGSASTRSITRPDEKEWAALVCSACASERPMWRPLKIKSVRGAGTKIEVLIPLPPGATAVNLN